MSAHPPESSAPNHLVRGIGLAQATALNMIDMIGVGPFITIPLMIAAMHGPQAMLGWIAGAVLVVAAILFVTWVLGGFLKHLR